jgi:hypothetical protein
MLGVLAAIALVVGGVSTTMVLSENGRLAAEENHSPVVSVQPVQPVQSVSPGGSQ